eukprot:Sspe_Gene.55876::Locus_30734_Transcript_1_1_Confidence_1.000_Length_2102::g.55876::m.55876
MPHPARSSVSFDYGVTAPNDLTSKAKDVAHKMLTRPKIPPHLEDEMGPVDKWLEYGRFPCKMSLNILICLLLTVEVLVYTPDENYYVSDSILALSDLFTPDGPDGDSTALTSHFYDVEDVVDFMNTSLVAWDHLQYDPAGIYFYVRDVDGSRVLPVMTVTIKANGTYRDLIHDTHSSLETRTVVCTLNRTNPYGPYLWYVKHRKANPSPSPLGTPSPRRRRMRDLGISESILRSQVSHRVQEDEKSPVIRVGDCEGIDHIFGKSYSAEVRFKLRCVRLEGMVSPTECLEWDLVQRYDFSSRTGAIAFSLSYRMSRCHIPGVGRSSGTPPALVLTIFVTIFAAWDFLLRLKSARAVYRSWREGPSTPETYPFTTPATFPATRNEGRVDDDLLLATSVPSQTCNGAPPEDDLVSQGTTDTSSTSHPTMKEAKSFGVGQEAAEVYPAIAREEARKAFRGRHREWLVTAILSDLVVIAAEGVELYVSREANAVSSMLYEVRSSLKGFATFFAWIMVISYLGHQPRFYLLMKTLRRGTPRALKFVAGCFPILMAYAMLGTVAFGSYADRFSTLDSSFVTLFSVMNGDIIDDTFDSIFLQGSPFLQVFSRVYLYTFISLFIYAILNIFLAIMEDAYFQVKRQLLLGLQDVTPP